MSCSARLLTQCADQPGIVAAVTRFLFEHDANVTHLDQHSTEMTGGLFYMRAEFQLPDLEPPNAALRTAFAAQVGDPFDMHWSMVDAGVKKRMVIFASRTEHTLQELLWRHARGDLAAEITAALTIPVIGIGAGAATDAQVLVLHDMLGLCEHKPKFVRNFLAENDSVQAALKAYNNAVKEGSFPAAEHGFS